MTAVPEMPIDVKAFATSITAFLQWAQESAGRPAGVQGMVDLLNAHLGTERAALSVVSQNLPGYEQVNLQTALNAWIAESGRRVTVHGVSVPPHWSGLTLQPDRGRGAAPDPAVGTAIDRPAQWAAGKDPGLHADRHPAGGGRPRTVRHDGARL